MAHMSPEALDAELLQMALTLKSLGFNLNFAPVVDLNLQQEQGIIGALHRSFSVLPEQVIGLAKQFVDVFLITVSRVVISIFQAMEVRLVIRIKDLLMLRIHFKKKS